MKLTINFVLYMVSIFHGRFYNSRIFSLIKSYIPVMLSNVCHWIYHQHISKHKTFSQHILLLREQFWNCSCLKLWPWFTRNTPPKKAIDNRHFLVHYFKSKTTFLFITCYLFLCQKLFCLHFAQHVVFCDSWENGFQIKSISWIKSNFH